jgi:hypothetical protein
MRACELVSGNMDSSSIILDRDMSMPTSQFQRWPGTDHWQLIISGWQRVQLMDQEERVSSL